MVKLFRSAMHPNQWVANVPGQGWVAFPARPQGWAERRPVRGLDPVHLRQVALTSAQGTGLLEWVEEEVLQVA